MLETMSDFFKNRLDGYDEHMRAEVECGDGFYRFTAAQLPKSDCHILDLGCGTGLELEEFLKINPTARVTGIDLCREMLDCLRAKFPDNGNLNLICKSYFDIQLGEEVYDAAVSVESLHHFTAEQKSGLYKKLHRALKRGGYFILTDYFAESEALEQEYFKNLRLLRQEQGLSDCEFYHYDTPLTVEHEIEVLRQAGFENIEIFARWDSTCCIKACA